MLRVPAGGRRCLARYLVPDRRVPAARGGRRPATRSPAGAAMTRRARRAAPSRRERYRAPAGAGAGRARGRRTTMPVSPGGRRARALARRDGRRGTGHRRRSQRLRRRLLAARCGGRRLCAAASWGATRSRSMTQVLANPETGSTTALAIFRARAIAAGNRLPAGARTTAKYLHDRGRIACVRLIDSVIAHAERKGALMPDLQVVAEGRDLEYVHLVRTRELRPAALAHGHRASERRV